MKKTLLLLAAFASLSMPAFAEYQTAGNGTAYTLESLSAIAESGITKDGSVYTVAQDVTVTAGDSFTVEPGATIQLADGVTFRIDGVADFVANAEKRVLVTRSSDDAEPLGIYVACDTEGSGFAYVDFEYASLRAFGSVGFNVDNCTFRYGNGAMSITGTLALGAAGACFEITNCVFEENYAPAISTAFNMANGVVIEDCEFFDNNQGNSNNPQITLTAGGNNDIAIRNCTITGTGRNRVGGIGISNLGSMSGTNLVEISGCNISENRYGITGTGPMNMKIKDNVLTNNLHETNPMAGGSGLNMTYVTNCEISGNTIDGHLWGITLVSVSAANCGEVDNPECPGNNVFRNNGNGGVLYDLYNNSTATVYAQNNIWNVSEQTAEQIATVIFDKSDNPSLGEVIYMPAGTPTSSTLTALDPSKPYTVNGKLIVPGAEKGSVTVYTADGRQVATLPLTNCEADLMDLTANGVYVLSVNANGKSYNLKYSR